MRIPCPYCGPRSNDEFVYHGDATLRRPDTSAAKAGDDHAERVVLEYVYLRENPAGPHRELWFHAAGCHAWLVVERDTRTHAIFSAVPAAGPASRGEST
jgi:methylglutamate dehydrogenase subunit B